MNLPSRVSRIRSASLSTERWRDIDAPVTGNFSTISPADIHPPLRRLRISLLIGSARAFKVLFIPKNSSPSQNHLTFSLIVKCMIPQFMRIVKIIHKKGTVLSTAPKTITQIYFL